MRRALLIALLALPVVANDVDPKRILMVSISQPSDFEEIYYQLASDQPPPAGLYAFALENPHTLRFKAAEWTYIAGYILQPVHDGEARNESQSLLPVKSGDGHTWGIRVRNMRAGQRIGVVFDGKRWHHKEERLRYLVIVKIDPESAPWLMDTDDPGLYDATGISDDAIEHVIEARILEIWTYDVQTGNVLGKQDCSKQLR